MTKDSSTRKTLVSSLSQSLSAMELPRCSTFHNNYSHSHSHNDMDKAWKEEEARVMFSLFQSEYENSKTLSMPRRYKELERIIKMFTSEQVLHKLKWLSEDDVQQHHHHQQEEENLLYTDGEDNSVCCSFDDIIDDDDDDNEDINSNQTLVSEVKHFFSRMTKLRSLFPAPENTTTTTTEATSPTPIASCDSDESTNNNNCFFNFQQQQPTSSTTTTTASSNYYKVSSSFSGSSSSCSLKTGGNVSAPSTPVSPSFPDTVKLFSSQSWPVFKRFLSEPFTNLFVKQDAADSSDSSPDTNTTPTPTHCSSTYSSDASDASILTLPTPTQRHRTTSACTTSTASEDISSGYDFSSATSTPTYNKAGKTRKHRPNALDLHIIQRDRIPDFEIPALRKPSSKSETDMGAIIPSLYITPTSKPNSPRPKKWFQIFRISQSSPSIDRMHTVSSSSDFECQQPQLTKSCSSRKLWNKMRHGVRRKSKSFSVDRPCCRNMSVSSSTTSSSIQDNFNILEAHQFLVKMKEDFEKLSNGNMFSKYKQMKKMFKEGEKFIYE